MRNDIKKSEVIGTPVISGKSTWVQTERSAHEAWAKLIAKSPRAASLLHHLIARMGHQNAVVISQKNLAQLMGCSTRTIKYALAELISERWVQVVQIGLAGSVNAYVVNDQVGWTENRDNRFYSLFSAAIVADSADQPPTTLEHRSLRKIPIVFSGEQQLPSGAGEPPPFQPPFGSMLPDLPLRSYDPETREIINEEK